MYAAKRAGRPRLERARRRRRRRGAGARRRGAIRSADAAERAARGDRSRLELVPAGRVHGRRGLVEAHRRDLRAGAHRRGADRHRQRSARSRSSARSRRSTCSPTSAARAASAASAVDAVATSAIRDAENAEELPRRARASASALPIRVLSREAGGALRLPGGGQLDDAHRRLRARPRRRLDAARARRRAARARARLLARWARCG